MGKTNRKPKKAGDSATGELPHATAQSEARKIGRRLILKFVGEDKPELDRIEFRFKESTAPVFWQRGDDTHGFVWTEVPQAFSILFLDYLWSASLKSSEPFFFRGAKNGSHAASLGDAIHQPKHRIHELFIETFPSGGTTNCVRRVFTGDNLHGKADRERRVSVKSDFLPPDCVEVFWGERGPLAELEDVQLLANRIRESLGLITARIEGLPERGGDTSESITQTPTTPAPQQPIGDAPAVSQPQPPPDDKIPADIVGEALASVSALPNFSARDIATEDELYRLWQIDCAAYGERSITFEQFFAQWQAFPHFPKALFFQTEIAAAIGILPTTEARMKDFAEGRVSEASLQDDPLGQFMIGNVNAWLIDGMVRNPKFPMAATRELVCSSILSWINDGLISYPLNLYAIGQNRRGMNLITRAGFKLIKTAESLPDGMPFYALHIESEAQLLRLLLERLRCYANITP